MSFQPELLPPLPLTVAQAIARVEGWYAQGKTANRPQRNNNPGDIEFHAWMTEKYDAILEQGTAHPRFACFPTAQAGWQALEDLLAGPHYAGLTLEAAVNRFAPPSENDTVNYVSAVCRWTGKQSTETV
jgi:hypothetical protein